MGGSIAEQALFDTKELLWYRTKIYTMMRDAMGSTKVIF